jgi:predicted type IV restriction endonuclease
MATMPTKVKDRLAAGIKRFQPILASAKTRDVNESDTVTIVTDMLADIFGFDKYSEITSEYVIKSTYVDLAIKLDGKVELLIEVKAIGLEPKEAYTKQAVDYAANQGIEWVILTNGAKWQIYKVSFGKPINQDMVLEIDLMNVNPKNQADLDNLYLITKEGINRSVLGEYHTQRQALSRFFIGAIVLSDPVLEVIRRQLRTISPDVKILSEQIRDVLLQDVFKRDVVEGEKAEEARRKVARAAGRVQKRTVVKTAGSNGEQEDTGTEADEADLEISPTPA